MKPIATAASVLLLAGCTTSLHHEKLNVGNQPKSPAVGYFLPKQRYTVSATYELRSCPNANGTAAEKSAPLILKQTATVAEASVTDTSEYYAVPLKTLTSGWKTTSLTISLYENGTLKSIGATADDQTGAVLTGIISTAASIARIAVGAPTSLALVKPTLCTPDVYAALKTIQTSQAKLIDPNLDDKVRANLAAAILSAKSVVTISKSYTFDPTRISPNGSGEPSKEELLTWFATPGLIAASPQKDEFSRTLKTGFSVEEYPSTMQPVDPRYDGQGIIFREPTPILVKICTGICNDAKATELASLRTSSAQFGRYVVLPLKNRPFEKNNLSASFTAAGMPDTVAYGTESRLVKMAAALSTTATSVEDVASKARTTKEASAEKASTAEVSALKAQTDLLNAKADKIEAEQRLAKLGGEQE